MQLFSIVTCVTQPFSNLITSNDPEIGKNETSSRGNFHWAKNKIQSAILKGLNPSD